MKILLIYFCPRDRFFSVFVFFFLQMWWGFFVLCTVLLRLQIRVLTKIPELFSLMVHLSSWQELVWSYL